MFRSSGMPIVFGGASLAGIGADLRARIDCRPPVSDGDLVRIAAANSRRPILILDGLFSDSRALTPTECRDMLRNGWTVLGASSMGALRAADLWPEGMIGVGDVYLGLRTGLLRGDGEVAVALNPFTFEEMTVTTVFLRAAAGGLLAAELATATDARRIVHAAASVHFFDRTPEACNESWIAAGVDEPIRVAALAYLAVPRNNPKVRDARLALGHLLATLWPMSHMGKPVTDTGLQCDLAPPGAVTCRACGNTLPSAAIFCAHCASTAHEEQ